MNNKLEREKILQLIKNKRITPQDGMKLLNVIQSKKKKKQMTEQKTVSTQKIVDVKDNTLEQDIAIIGMSGRFAGATNLDDFWNNLTQGKDLVTDVPDGHWDMRDYINLEQNYSTRGAFIDNVDLFDPFFFNIPPIEAEMMDPNQRIFLEEAYKALEDAGYSNTALSDYKCGVYVGATNSDYIQKVTWNDKNNGLIPHAMIGFTASMLASRISYYLNLKGPTITIETACSSSLVAICKACQSIVLNESDMAITGGISITVTPFLHIMSSGLGIMSPTGTCRPFDKDADGTIISEGAGVIILKKYSKAIADGDHIYGVIKGFAVNQDGRTNGITAPSAESQASLELDVYKQAGINPETITYLETHGTGTQLGDPIEIKALTKAFRTYTDKKNYCAIGSVKSNIGHTTLAAGVSSVIKTALCLKNNQLPPMVHFKSPNSHLNLDESPFYVNTELEEWKSQNGIPRRAAVSSFGYSGTNAHVLIEEAPCRTSDKEVVKKTSYLIPLSAKTDESLKQKVRDLYNWIDNNKSAFIGNVAYTLLIGRSHFNYRMVFLAEDLQDLYKQLGEKIKNDFEDCPVCRLENASLIADPDIKQKFQSILNEIIHGAQSSKSDYRNGLDQIARLYLKGYSLDFYKLYTDTGYNRIPLPTYPFIGDRYWIPDSAKEHITSDSTSLPEEQLATFYYKTTWNFDTELLDENIDIHVDNIKEDITLIFDDSDKLYNSYRDQVWNKEGNTSNLVLIKPGKKYHKSDENSYTLNPGRYGDYQKLFTDLEKNNQTPGNIIVNWSEPGKATGDHDTLLHRERGIYTLFNIAKTILAQKLNNQIPVLYLFCADDPVQRPFYNSLSGTAKSINQENPNILCKVIELQKADITDYIRVLCYELQQSTLKDVEIRYENRKRYVKCLTEVEKNNLNVNKLPIKENGVYLITGGVGGLGLIFARYLASQYRARLMLTGRSALSDEKKKIIDELIATGSEVHYIQSDVSKVSDVKKLIKRSSQLYGNINGIIHSAGVIKDSFIINKSQDQIDQVLAPKIDGTINLDECTQDEKLDFFVLFSSLVAVIGNTGQSDYACANGFLDNFAELRNRYVEQNKRYGRTLAVNWPLWLDGGMQISEEERNVLSEHMGMKPITAELGIQALETALQTNQNHFLPLYGYKHKVQQFIHQQFENYVSGQNFNTVAGGNAMDTSTEGDSIPTNSDQMYNETEDYLKGLFVELFKLPVSKIDPHTRFEDYGINSIMIAQFNSKLESDIGRFPKTLLFECRTINELTDNLVNNHAQALIKLFNMNQVKKEAQNKIQPYRQSLPVPARKNILDKDSSEDDIAIIGMSGRYPDAATLDQLWDNLIQGKDSVREVPADRWDCNAFYNEADPGNSEIYCKWGGFLQEVDTFDPLFFKITPRLADSIDPQERIFLETAWALLEDAGYTVKRLKQSVSDKNIPDVGVFVGVTSNTYEMLGAEREYDIPISRLWAIANRISFLFDFEGPSMPVDTACSSSLTAVHLACKSIKNGECCYAIAGGVNLYLHPSKYQALCSFDMLSRSGRCHTFGNNADGFVPGEGAGAILLKSLKQAKSDGDRIYGIIKGSAINHGGRTNGFSVPNPAAQAGVIEKAIADAKIDPRTISYIEAHGTGTKLGDPIEISGLSKVFSTHTNDAQSCAIGSIKSNIGHLESAAGISGLTKILLQFKNKKLVPSLHSKVINPNIYLEDTPFYIQQRVSDWNQPEININGVVEKFPRIAGVSSFGAGGTNVHVVLEEYVDEEADDNQNAVSGLADNSPQLIVLSAKNKARLKEYVKKYIDYFDTRINTSRLFINESDLFEQVTSEVIHTVSNALGVDPESVDCDESLVVLGCDILTINEICRSINDKLSLQLSESVFAEYPDVESIADFMISSCKTELCNYFYPTDESKAAEKLKAPGNLCLTDVAYTLQIGREAMDERLAIVASTLEDLYVKLNSFYKNQTNGTDIYTSNINDTNQSVGIADGLQNIKSMIIDRQLDQLAQLWVAGNDIDWNEFYSDQKPKCISLPTYPFAKERYWLPEVYKSVSVKSTSAQPPAKLETKTLQKAWRSVAAVVEKNQLLSGSIVVIVNEATRHIGELLFKNNKNVQTILVTHKQGHPVSGDRHLAADLTLYSNGQTIVRTIAEKKVAMLIDLSDVHYENQSAVDLQLGKIAILQGLIERNSLEQFLIFHFSRGLQTFESDQATVNGATYAGFIKMLSAEYAKVHAKTIDVDDFSENSVARQLETIIETESALTGQESEICFRNGRRYIPVMNEISQSKVPWQQISIDPDRVYVITGGTSGIGMQVAGRLADMGVKKLVLMGIRELPARSNWECIISDGSEDVSLREKLQNILSLEQAGINVELYIGSLSNYDELQTYFNGVRKNTAPIGGVIHCAGLVIHNDPAFINKAPDDIEKVFEPKCKGLLNLHSIFENDNLDFFVLFSSVSAVVPALASAVIDYGAANAFMDYFANYQHSIGNTYYKSINWPSWEEVGMGKVKSPAYVQLGFETLLTKHGLDLLFMAIGFKATPVVMMAVANPNIFNAQSLLWVQAAAKGFMLSAGSSSGTAPVGTGVVSGEHWLTKLFSEELKIPVSSLDGNTSFGDYGVDSILLAGLIKKIEALAETVIEPSVLLENPTLNQLVAYCDQNNIGTHLNQINENVPAPSTGNEKLIQVKTPELKKYTAENEDYGQKTTIINNSPQTGKIAVIGMSCNLPGSPNTEKFWEMLSSGKSAISEVPQMRWDIDQFYSPEVQEGKSISKWGGFVENIEYYDPDYFEIKKVNASKLDPFIRLILESSEDCIRNAGYTKKDLWNSKVGVYIGSRISNYRDRIKEITADSITVGAQNFIAAHISHYYNFKGPNLVVDTACSSSLVSIHLACQGLVSNECELALAGGVDLLLDELPYLGLSVGALSPDGKCYTFDERANGFVPGEGSGAVLLKTLEKAIADGDTIHAVIEASAVNNDGHTMGVTTPNPQAQKAVIEDALHKGGINPDSIGYLEAHGTGTLIGDPIELKALTEVYRKSTDKKQFCAIGSVKTNIGHALSAAGIASFIKTVLCIKNHTLVPTLNCERPNPRFKFEESPFYVNKKCTQWDSNGSPLMAGISAFGFGGTNAHIIVSECDESLLHEYAPKRQPLPPASFNKKRYWIEKEQEIQSLQPNDEYFDFGFEMSNEGEYEFFEASEVDGDEEDPVLILLK